MPDLVALFGAYVRDGFLVFLRPVTAISRSAARRLSWGLIVGVLALLILTVTSIDWVLVQMLTSGGTGFPQDTDLASPLAAAASAVSGFVYFFILGGLLFLIAFVIRRRADPRRFFSAFLIYAGIGAALSIVQLAVILVARVSQSNAFLEIVLLLSQIGPVALSLILMSYAVLVARFGGELSFAWAFFAVAIYILAVIIFEIAYGQFVSGVPVTPFDLGNSFLRIVR